MKMHTVRGGHENEHMPHKNGKAGEARALCQKCPPPSFDSQIRPFAGSYAAQSFLRAATRHTSLLRQIHVSQEVVFSVVMELIT